jgi:membrane-associated phospholipid phosphatase
MTDLQIVRLSETLLGVGTALALLYIALPDSRPWDVVSRSVRRLLRSPARMLYLAACFAILGINYLYLALDLDRHCTMWIAGCNGGRDFTHLIYGIEGDALAHVQAAVACLPLTWYLGFVYVIVFPCLVFVAIFVFDHLDDRRGLAMVLIGYAVNFLIVLPFYVAFPIRETFVYYQQSGAGGPAVRMLLDDVHPTIMVAYRVMSGVDNCFPSFHTSLTVTLALLAAQSGRRGFAVSFGILGASIVLSTMYLGVHWICDVATGIGAGVLSYWIARLLSRRWAPAEEAHG